MKNNSWEKKGDFNQIITDTSNAERLVSYISKNANSAFGDAELISFKSNKKIRFCINIREEEKFNTYVNMHNEYGFGKLETFELILHKLSINVSPDDKHRIGDYLAFLHEKIENIDFIKKDISSALNLKPSIKELHQQLTTTYKEQGYAKALEMSKQALEDDYPDAVYMLAKYCWNMKAYDDAYSLLCETPQDQREHINELRFELAQFIFTSSEENIEHAVRLLLITDKSQAAAQLRAPAINQLAGIYGQIEALEAAGADIKTIINLCKIIRDKMLIIQKQADEIIELKEKLAQLELKGINTASQSFFNYSQTKNTESDLSRKTDSEASALELQAGSCTPNPSIR